MGSGSFSLEGDSGAIPATTGVAPFLCPASGGGSRGGTKTAAQDAPCWTISIVLDSVPLWIRSP